MKVLVQLVRGKTGTTDDQFVIVCADVEDMIDKTINQLNNREHRFVSTSQHRLEHIKQNIQEELEVKGWIYTTTFHFIKWTDITWLVGYQT